MKFLLLGFTFAALVAWKVGILGLICCAVAYAAGFAHSLSRLPKPDCDLSEEEMLAEEDLEAERKEQCDRMMAC